MVIDKFVDWMEENGVPPAAQFTIGLVCILVLVFFTDFVEWMEVGIALIVIMLYPIAFFGLFGLTVRSLVEMAESLK